MVVVSTSQNSFKFQGSSIFVKVSTAKILKILTFCAKFTKFIFAIGDDSFEKTFKKIKGNLVCDTPSSTTITVFSSSRVFHWIVTNTKMRSESLKAGES